MPYTPITSLPGSFSRDYVARALTHVDQLMEGDTVLLPGGQCQEGGAEHFDLETTSPDSIRVRWQRVGEGLFCILFE